MSSGDNAGAPAREELPQSHRRPGPAVLRFPTETRFWNSVWDNPRELMSVALAIFAALAYGAQAVTSRGSVAHQALGVVVAGAGLLLLASYVLHFHPSALDGDRWSRSRSRRAARAVLRYFWGTFEVIVLLALLAWLVTWLFGRL